MSDERSHRRQSAPSAGSLVLTVYLTLALFFGISAPGNLVDKLVNALFWPSVARANMEFEADESGFLWIAEADPAREGER